MFSREADTRMTKALDSVHKQMDVLKSDKNTERDRLQRDNGRLKDLVSELRLKGQTEVESYKKEIGRMAEQMEAELNTAEERRAAAVRERDTVKRVGSQFYDHRRPGLLDDRSCKPP